MRPARELLGVAVNETEAQLRAWMIASQAGEAPAYRRLLAALQARLEVYYRRRLGDPSSAEDLVQETLMAVHAKRDTYDPDQPFTAWAYAIARYKLIDHYRRYRRHSHAPLEDEAVFMGQTDAGFGAAEARMDVERLLEELPEGQVRALRMTKIEELSVAEAAEASATGASAIKVRVHRGLKTLMTRLGTGAAK